MTSLLSRYAECVFWLARYIERAESLARIIEVNASFQRGRPGADNWTWIVTLHADEEAFRSRFPTPTAADVVQFYVSDPENPGSILAAIHAARENARSLRSLISTDMWFQLNDFHSRLLAFGPADFNEMRLSRSCDAIKRGCYGLLGVAEATLYRDESWPFFRLGLFMERADQTSRLLDVRFAQRAASAINAGAASPAPDYDYTLWSTLLRSASAYHAFRRVHPQGMDAADVARFLIFDARLPRSIASCAGEIQRMINQLAAVHRLRHAHRASEQMEIIMEGLEAAFYDRDLSSKLHDFDDWIQRRLMALTDELGVSFFGHQNRAAQVQGQTQGQGGQAQGQGQAQMAN
jgi:uncharacterized alpha-E superfamily protein